MPGDTREAEKPILAYVTVTHPALSVSVAPLASGSGAQEDPDPATEEAPGSHGQTKSG